MTDDTPDTTAFLASFGVRFVCLILSAILLPVAGLAYVALGAVAAGIVAAVALVFGVTGAWPELRRQ